MDAATLVAIAKNASGCPWVNKVALLPAHERSALFGETGATRGVANTIVEKDFWVCGTLRRLFEVPKEDVHLALQRRNVLIQSLPARSADSPRT
ncbi:hypothetical protein X769_13975 [Mesorhizobium sp. LSJC268A00]|nr:hypothetical protein X769_13975 [Mesorhizobium sp. LSJC268A00]